MKQEELIEEIKIFLKFFAEVFMLLIIIQLVSKKIDNKDIRTSHELKVALVVASILYMAKLISQDSCDNIRQGFHYAISGVFLGNYSI